MHLVLGAIDGTVTGLRAQTGPRVLTFGAEVEASAPVSSNLCRKARSDEIGYDQHGMDQVARLRSILQTSWEYHMLKPLYTCMGDCLGAKRCSSLITSGA